MSKFFVLVQLSDFHLGAARGGATLSSERPGYLLHALVDGELVSSVYTIP